MGLHRHVRGRRFTWLIALVFTVFLFPTVLWAADEQDSILGEWKVTASTPQGTESDNHITFSQLISPCCGPRDCEFVMNVAQGRRQQHFLPVGRLVVHFDRPVRSTINKIIGRCCPDDPDHAFRRRLQNELVILGREGATGNRRCVIAPGCPNPGPKRLAVK